MSHNYINPAFCLQSELYVPPVKVQRNEASSIISNVSRVEALLPPKPGPKPTKLLRNDSINQSRIVASDNRDQIAQIYLQTSSSTTKGRYALVPIEEISKSDDGRYAVIPLPKPEMISREENCFELTSSSDIRLSCPVVPFDNQPRLKNAFSTNFDPKNFFLNDSRYTIVPTEKDEELVDDNHEIVEIHNGRIHRYAVVPTDEDETCLSDGAIPDAVQRSPMQNHNYATIRDCNTTPQRLSPLKMSSPEKFVHQKTDALSLQKSLATQRLHELLSTPKKSTTTTKYSCGTPEKLIRRDIETTSPTTHKVIKSSKLHPQRLQYESRVTTTSSAVDARTTAVITPRLQAPSLYGDQAFPPSDPNKSWNNLSFEKVANATATIGAVSLMMILSGAMNSGLCLYMVSNLGRFYYLDMGIISGFAAFALGILGFRSRQCAWLPNRNYVSGYILVTVFSLLNCCGLLVLLTVHPIPGTPIHDTTTGVVLGLSSLTLLLISLGVITSRWCRSPPPDNRVDVC